VGQTPAGNGSRRAINQAVRQVMQALGVLEKQDHPIEVLAPRSDITGADRAWTVRYQAGDVLHYVRGSKERASDRARRHPIYANFLAV
jgi:hypothetical protein